MHVRLYLLHDFDGAGRAGHHAGSQSGQIEVAEVLQAELGYEHGGHSVQGGAAFGLNGRKDGCRLEGLAGENHRRAVREAAKDAHDHAEAVIQRDRNA